MMMSDAQRTIEDSRTAVEPESALEGLLQEMRELNEQIRRDQANTARMQDAFAAKQRDTDAAFARLEAMR
jgi:hypothetical protein